MDAVWTPENAAPLVEATEDERDIVATVEVEAPIPEGELEPDEIVDLSWSASPPFPSQFDVSVSLMGSTASLTLTIPHFAGYFPILELRYLLDGVEGVCFAWEDLPEAAEDVIAYRPDPAGVKETVLTVTASFETAPQESRDYVIRVTADYSLGRDALVEAVDARR